MSTSPEPTHLVTIGRRYGRPPTSGNFRAPAIHAAWRERYGWRTACGRYIGQGDVDLGGLCRPLAPGHGPTCRRCRAARLPG